MVQLSNYCPIILLGMYKNADQAQWVLLLYQYSKRGFHLLLYDTKVTLTARSVTKMMSAMTSENRSEKKMSNSSQVTVNVSLSFYERDKWKNRSA